MSDGTRDPVCGGLGHPCQVAVAGVLRIQWQSVASNCHQLPPLKCCCLCFVGFCLACALSHQSCVIEFLLSLWPVGMVV
jgi:hypothetical protein